MPGEDGVRLGNRRDFCQGFPPQFLTNLSKGQTIAVTQRHTTHYLLAEDPIFGYQIRVAQAEFLIDGACDRCQQLLPVHVPFHPSCGLSLVVSMGHSAVDCETRSGR